MRQQEALNILKTGVNAYLTGEPGSGKTHTTHEYISWLKERGIEPAVTASTGIAATHVGGMTIHSWSGIGVKERLSRADLDYITSKEHVVRRMQRTSVLIIDEISMLSGETVSMVDAVLKETRRNDKPFGGVQIVFIGDFFQLPPILKGGEPVFAFESRAWKEANPLPLYLHEQHRQDDAALTEILSNVRRRAADHSDISRILEREAEDGEVPGDIPRLYTHNADVDRENNRRLEALKGKKRTYLMNGSGAPALVDALKRGCLSPELLELKEGAVVMFTKNNQPAGYLNGTTGVVTGFERGGLPIVTTKDGRDITVYENEWVVEEEGKQKAKITQLPLKLAWALTIHKSQGQSLDSAAMDLSKTFEYGQGYVALSRLRTLSGLHLLGFHENALRVHPKVEAVDEEFKSASRIAAHTFDELERSLERAELERRFVEASGGSYEARKEKEVKQSTHDATLALIEDGKPLADIAKARGLTLGTIADHVEKLVHSDRLPREAVEPLLSKELQGALPVILKAFSDVGHERLAPAFSKLNKRYTFDELRLARALYVPQ